MHIFLETGIDIARDKIVARSNHNREHRKLTGVKTMYLGTNYKYRQFLLSRVLQVFQI